MQTCQQLKSRKHNSQQLNAVMHTFNPGTKDTDRWNLCEFKAILLYRVSSKDSEEYIGRPYLKNRK